MNRNTRRHAAFTLVELLVVITIIGMLMALLLPAVNAAVEAARQASCKNKINQLSLAVISFESQKTRYPGYKMPLGGNAHSWVVPILPFVDHHDWYDEFNNGATEARYSELFVCDSNPPTSTAVAANAYVINAGYANVAKEYEIPANGIAHNYMDNGVATTQEYVSGGDGTTYTLLITENVQADVWNKHGVFDNQNAKYHTVFTWHDNDSPTVRRINNRGDKASLLEVPRNADSARPSSFHTGGVNVAFCDRRTIFLTESVDYIVYQQLMTPKGRDARCANSTSQNNLRAHVLSDDQYQ